LVGGWLSLPFLALVLEVVEDKSSHFKWYKNRPRFTEWHATVSSGIGRLENPEMVRHHAHLSADHLAPYADRLCALRVVDVPESVPQNGTFMAQSQK
jgi:hypothetical protein